MAHKAVPLEPQVFLDNFLKGPCQHLSGTMPPLEGNPFEDLAGAADMVESQISELFVAAVNKNSNLAQGLKMALSENSPDPGESDGAKIDAAFFRPELLPTDGRPHWADQMVSVEFKAHGTANDPYDDREPGNTIDAHAATRKHVRGQIIHYAEKVFQYQHRTSLFMVLIIGRRFRISRWDRSGTIVTRSVDYVDQPEILYEMLWYVSRLSDEALGLDPTAHRVMPGSDEYAQMLQAKDAPVGLPDVDHKERDLVALPSADAVFGYVRKQFADSLDVTFPWYRLEIPGPEGTRYFLVGKPAFCAPGMAGRGTKGFVALEVGSNPTRFVWLKDAWRTQYEFVAQEGAVLKELNDAKVAYVPTLVCHGDIPGQDTETPTWWERVYSSSAAALPAVVSPPQSAASSSRTLVNSSSRSSSSTKRSADDMENAENGRDACPLRRHKHYRIAVKEVGMKLVEFTHGRQLLQVVFDCMFAHQQAAVKANILHRDISGGNILILPKAIAVQADGPAYMKWTGLLVDWELSKPLKGDASLPRPRQPERTGTWQFMSAAVLDNHSKKLEISDELEAFFHVTLYYAVRYLRSNCQDVGSFVENYFDTYTVLNGTYKCGEKKSHAVKHATLTIDTSDAPLEFGSSLDDVFSEALRWFKAHYHVRRYKHAQKSQLLQRPTSSDSKVPAQPEFRVLAPEGFKRFSALSSITENKNQKKAIQEPTAQELEDATKVATHDTMLNAFYDAIVADNWPPDRVQGDNVPSDFKPRVPVGPPVLASLRTIKKRRTDAGSLLSEPPRTPPRPGTVI